jgi:hypothetical protein
MTSGKFMTTRNFAAGLMTAKEAHALQSQVYNNFPCPRPGAGKRFMPANQGRT